ncbi:hypothetical protein D3C78_1587500 [compost metagenome]
MDEGEHVQPIALQCGAEQGQPPDLLRAGRRGHGIDAPERLLDGVQVVIEQAGMTGPGQREAGEQVHQGRRVQPNDQGFAKGAVRGWHSMS